MGPKSAAALAAASASAAAQPRNLLGIQQQPQPQPSQQRSGQSASQQQQQQQQQRRLMDATLLTQASHAMQVAADQQQQQQQQPRRGSTGQAQKGRQSQQQQQQQQQRAGSSGSAANSRPGTAPPSQHGSSASMMGSPISGRETAASTPLPPPASDQLVLLRYELEMPVTRQLHKQTVHGFADVYPQTGDQREDDMGKQNIELGYKADPIVIELSSLTKEMSTKPLAEFGARLGDFLSVVIRSHDAASKLPPPSHAFQHPVRESSAQLEKKLALMQDLGSNEALEAILEKRIPHGLKDAALLETLAKHAIPLQRASWLIKIINLDIPLGPGATESISSRWTTTVLAYMKTLLVDLCRTPSGADSGSSKSTWTYTTQLLQWQYNDGLLDNTKVLLWLVGEFKLLTLEHLGFLVPLLCLFFVDICSSKLVASDLVDACLNKITRFRKYGLQTEARGFGTILAEGPPLMKVYYYTLIAFIQGVVLLSPEAMLFNQNQERHARLQAELIASKDDLTGIPMELVLPPVTAYLPLLEERFAAILRLHDMDMVKPVSSSSSTSTGGINMSTPVATPTPQLSQPSQSSSQQQADEPASTSVDVLQLDILTPSNFLDSEFWSQTQGGLVNESSVMQLLTWAVSMDRTCEFRPYVVASILQCMLANSTTQMASAQQTAVAMPQQLRTPLDYDTPSMGPPQTPTSLRASVASPARHFFGAGGSGGFNYSAMVSSSPVPFVTAAVPTTTSILDGAPTVLRQVRDRLQNCLTDFLDKYEWPTDSQANQDRCIDGIAVLFRVLTAQRLFSYDRFLERLIARDDLHPDNLNSARSRRFVEYIRNFAVPSGLPMYQTQRRSVLAKQQALADRDDQDDALFSRLHVALMEVLTASAKSPSSSSPGYSQSALSPLEAFAKSASTLPVYHRSRLLALLSTHIDQTLAAQSLRNMTPPMFDGSEDPSFSCGGVPVWSTWIYLLQKLGSSDGVVQLLDRILPHATNAMSTIYVLSMYDRMYPCFLLPGLAQQSFQSLYNAQSDLARQHGFNRRRLRLLQGKLHEWTSMQTIIVPQHIVSELGSSLFAMDTDFASERHRILAAPAPASIAPTFQWEDELERLFEGSFDDVVPLFVQLLVKQASLFPTLVSTMIEQIKALPLDVAGPKLPLFAALLTILTQSISVGASSLDEALCDIFTRHYNNSGTARLASFVFCAVGFGAVGFGSALNLFVNKLFSLLLERGDTAGLCEVISLTTLFLSSFHDERHNGDSMLSSFRASTVECLCWAGPSNLQLFVMQQQRNLMLRSPVSATTGPNSSDVTFPTALGLFARLVQLRAANPKSLQSPLADVLDVSVSELVCATWLRQACYVSVDRVCSSLKSSSTTGSSLTPAQLRELFSTLSGGVFDASANFTPGMNIAQVRDLFSRVFQKWNQWTAPFNILELKLLLDDVLSQLSESSLTSQECLNEFIDLAMQAVTSNRCGSLSLPRLVKQLNRPDLLGQVINNAQQNLFGDRFILASSSQRVDPVQAAYLQECLEISLRAVSTRKQTEFLHMLHVQLTSAVSQLYTSASALTLMFLVDVPLSVATKARSQQRTFLDAVNECKVHHHHHHHHHHQSSTRQDDPRLADIVQTIMQRMHFVKALLLFTAPDDTLCVAWINTLVALLLSRMVLLMGPGEPLFALLQQQILYLMGRLSERSLEQVSRDIDRRLRSLDIPPVLARSLQGIVLSASSHLVEALPSTSSRWELLESCGEGPLSLADFGAVHVPPQASIFLREQGLVGVGTIPNVKQQRDLSNNGNISYSSKRIRLL